MLRFQKLCAAVLLAACLSGPLTATPAAAAMPTVEPETPRPLTDTELAEIVDFIVGNAVFALYHQAGHMMAARFGLDAADEAEADRFATMLLLDPRSGAGDQTLVDAIDSYRLAAHEAGGVPRLPDRHSVDAARAEAIACDMVGADPGGFADVADALGLDPAKREACAGIRQEAVERWRRVLAPATLGADAPGPPLPVAYDPPLDQDVAEATILEDNGVLEEVAARLGASYAFATPPKLRAMHCGAPTSRYDAAHNELVLCYELSAHHGQLILRDIERRG